jgi:hypothetical protein
VVGAEQGERLRQIAKHLPLWRYAFLIGPIWSQRNGGPCHESSLMGLVPLHPVMMREGKNMIWNASRLNRRKVAVVYLARWAEGVNAFRRFADTYRRHQAGMPHDLVVIYKGCDQVSQLNEARAAFAKLPHVGIELDDSGFDIGAYFAAARQLEHEFLCFLNTFTELEVDGWLALLHRYASMPNVGMAGAMGSYESLIDSVALMTKVVWYWNAGSTRHDERIAHYYDSVVDKNRKAQRDGRQSESFRAKLRRWIDFRTIEDRFRRHWQSLTQDGGVLSEHARFPGFPNPHIRSNGFMISRQRLLATNFPSMKSKWEAYGFESGPDSLTHQMRRLALAAVVVARNGKGYDVPDWSRSVTFRLGDQSNLILTDNQSRRFSAIGPGEQAAVVRMTWGDYLQPAPSDFPDFGVKFAVNHELIDPTRGHVFGDDSNKEEKRRSRLWLPHAKLLRRWSQTA